MWHEQKVRVRKALALGRTVFFWVRMVTGSANSCDWGWAPAGASIAESLLRPVPRAKYTKNKVSDSRLLLSRTKVWDVIFSVTLVLVKCEKMKVKHCAKCDTQWQGYLELICFVFEFHYYHCSLWAVLEGWISASWESGSRMLGLVGEAELIHPEFLLLSPHRNNAEVLLLHFHRLRMGRNKTTCPPLALLCPGFNHTAIFSGLHQDGKLLEGIFWGQKIEWLNACLLIPKDMESCFNFFHCVSYILVTNEYFSVVFSFLPCSASLVSSRTMWLCPQLAARCSAHCGTWSELQNIPISSSKTLVEEEEEPLSFPICEICD